MSDRVEVLIQRHCSLLVAQAQARSLLSARRSELRSSIEILLVGRKNGVVRASERRGGALEVIMNLALVEALVGVFRDEILLIEGLVSHGGLPLSAQLGNLLLVVELGVVVLADSAEALPEGEMVGVNGNAVVLVLTVLTDELPAALLFLEVKASGVGKPDECEDHTSKTEPGEEVEALLGGNIVVQDTGKESTELTAGGRKTVSSGTDRGREDFTSGKEGDGVRTELDKEGGQEVHGLEGVDASLAVVAEIESRDREEDEVHQEADVLHPLASVELIVNEEC